MLIIDAHLDLSMNALQGNRDLLRSAYTIRTQETGISRKGQGTVALPDMRQGRIAPEFCYPICPFNRQTCPSFRFCFTCPIPRHRSGAIGLLPCLRKNGIRPHHHEQRKLGLTHQHLADMGKQNDRSCKRLR